VPNWFSWENQGAGVAVADLTGNGRPDIVVFTIDNPPGVNRAIYQVGRDLDANGVATGGWSSVGRAGLVLLGEPWRRIRAGRQRRCS
jgi:hypothetical protein